MTAAAHPVRASATAKVPSLRVERRLLREGCVLLGAADEVGRGAPGGPVSSGVVVIDASVKRPPSGVRDSKLLSPAAREELETIKRNRIALERARPTKGVLEHLPKIGRAHV